MPEGLCEILPAQGGYHLEIGQRFLPPSSRGVVVNAMAIDCDTLDAAEAGDWGRPKMLFMDVRSVSDADLPDELAAALDEFERRFADQGLLGRDAHGVYIGQSRESLSGASAYSMIDGTAHIFSLVEFERQDAVERSWRAVAEYAQARAR